MQKKNERKKEEKEKNFVNGRKETEQRFII